MKQTWSSVLHQCCHGCGEEAPAPLLYVLKSVNNCSAAHLPRLQLRTLRMSCICAAADDGRPIPQCDAQQPCVPGRMRHRVPARARQRVRLPSSQGRAAAAFCQVCMLFTCQGFVLLRYLLRELYIRSQPHASAVQEDVCEGVKGPVLKAALKWRLIRAQRGSSHTS